ncbi:MAG: cupredoxin domain-containing protein [Actinomyces sp.]|nr:cupredoxin domain-containing protein [Actinomyces sp.]
MNASRTRLVIGVAAVSALGLSACVANNPSSTSASGSAGASDAPLTVTITDDTCKVSAASVPSGVVNFKLTNNGTVRNEFEILAEDKLRIVGERENLGPGTSVDYTVTLQPGKYFTACKKNMVGALVGATEFTVTDSGKPVEVSSDEQAQIDAAVTNYTAYVRDQSGQLLEQTKSFAELYKKGDFEAARKAYAPTRMYYERIEPTAEAFGDIDPALDQREADWQEEGADGEWTGWHAIEKDLWRPNGYQGLSEEQRIAMADKLVEDTQKLYDLVYSEAFSHTDLYDFVANVEGAKVAYGDVEDLAKAKDPKLAGKITDAFTELQHELDKHKDGDGYVSYDSIDEVGRKALSDKVNALRLPLAQLTAAIVQ